MATRLTKTAAPAPAPAAGLSAEDAYIVENGVPESDGLQSMLSELVGAANSKVTVYRAGKNQALAYVFACTPEEFSLDDLRDKFNGGDFRLFIAKDGKLWRNMKISVEPKQSPGMPAESMAPAPGPMSEIAALMRDSQAQQMAMMRAMMESRSSAASPFGNMDLPAVISSIAAAVTALRPPPAPVQPPPPDTSSKAIDMLLKGIELARELKGDGGGESSLMDVVRDLVKSPMLAQAVASAALPSPIARPPVQPRIQAMPPPRPPENVSHAKLEPAAVSEPQPNPSQLMFAHYVQMLVDKAAAGADAMLYAELILDSLSDDDVQAMLEQQPSTVDWLIGINPGVAAQRAWFQTLVDTIASAFEPDEAGDGAIELATPIADESPHAPEP